MSKYTYLFLVSTPRTHGRKSMVTLTAFSPDGAWQKVKEYFPDASNITPIMRSINPVRNLHSVPR